MTFEIGQIFEGEYPPEVALWCNENNAYIEEIESFTRMEEQEFLVKDEVYDEELNVVSEAEYETREVEVTVRKFQIVAIPEPTQEELAEQALMQAKRERSEAVANIVVEVDGMKFDGDETSQGRMARSAVAMTDEETITWVLHDNTIAQVTKAQLLQALRLAGEEQTRLWTMPYEG